MQLVPSGELVSGHWPCIMKAVMEYDEYLKGDNHRQEKLMPEQFLEAGYILHITSFYNNIAMAFIRSQLRYFCIKLKPNSIYQWIVLCCSMVYEINLKVDQVTGTLVKIA